MSDFNKLLLTMIAACGAAGSLFAADYADGVLLLNEGKYGTPGSICHLDAEGKWTDRAFAEANAGEATLGNTGSFAASRGDCLYIVSKQKNTAGAILTKAGSRTLRKLASASDFGFAASCQGRAFLPIDDTKGYLSTTLGVAVVKLEDLSLISSIEGLLNNAGKAVECGNMIRLDDRVFIATKSKFLYVIDPATDTIIETLDFTEITGNEKAYAASIVVGTDGALYCSVAGGTNGSTLPWLVKVTTSADDPSKLITETIAVPEEVYPPANSWYTWTPDAFCASPAAGALYWNGGASSFKSNQMLFKYDIAKGEFSKFYDFAEDKFLYGSAMRVNPADGSVYLAYVSGNAYSDATTLAKLNPEEGTVTAEWPMNQEYWYPCLPLFPDNEAPAATPIENPYQVDGDIASTLIDLRGLASDPDSHDALMTITLSENRNPELAEMEVKHGFLRVSPAAGALGSAIASVKYDSNGRTASLDIPLSISSSTGVADVAATDNSVSALRESATSLRLAGYGVAEVYTLSGALIARVNVDGTTSVAVTETPVIVRFGNLATKL